MCVKTPFGRGTVSPCDGFLPGLRPTHPGAALWKGLNVIISAVAFDFDGTLTRPHGIDFAAMRAAVGCPAGEPILEFINGLVGPARLEALRTLDVFEIEAAARAEPNLGAEATVQRLREMELPLAVLTRNTREAVDRALENFPTLGEDDFRVIIARDDVPRPKPDPRGLELIAEALGIPAAEILCVGDYVFDIELAHKPAPA